MIRVRGKTESGQSITGDAEGTIAEVAAMVLKQAEAAEDEIVQLTLKPVTGGRGIKIAEPRKRTPAEGKGKGKKK